MHVFGAVFALLLFVQPSRGATQPPRIVNNEYNVEFAPGPVLASNRVVGLGGAYSPLASGILGVAFNPAAYALREWYELDTFEWELDASIMFPGRFSQNDYFHNGMGRGLGTQNYFFLTAGLRFQYGNGAGGISLERRNFVVGEGKNRSHVRIDNWRFGVGYALLDSQLVIGGGLVVPNLQIAEHTEDLALITYDTLSVEFGAVLMLDSQPWRVGVSFRTESGETNEELEKETVPVDENGVRSLRGFILPMGLKMPWEFQIGVAVMIGSRQLNHKWRRIRASDEKLEHYRELRKSRKQERRKERIEYKAAQRAEKRRRRLQQSALRAGKVLPPLSKSNVYQPEGIPLLLDEDVYADMQDDTLDAEEERIEARKMKERERGEGYLLLSADAALIGPTRNSVGLDAFVFQEDRNAGDKLSLRIRVGVEAEVWPHYLRLRAGSYLEPSRYSNVDSRIHFTAGFTQRLFHVPDIWVLKGFDLKVSSSIDIARDYINWGLGFGVWH